MSEITELLEGDVNCLKSELNCLRSEFKLSRQLNQTLRELILKQLSSQIITASDQNPFSFEDQECQTTSFKASYAYLPFKTFNSIVNCKGCGEEFRAYTTGYHHGSPRNAEPAYYEHCIKQCNEYKKLGKFSGSSFPSLIIFIC